MNAQFAQALNGRIIPVVAIHDAKDNKGGTALMAAKREGHKEIVRILKEAGAKE